MNEISISIKDSETRFTEKYLDYDGIRMSTDDPKLKQLVDTAVIKFKAATNSREEDFDIVIKSKMIWQ
jgi:hypothetical protein